MPCWPPGQPRSAATRRRNRRSGHHQRPHQPFQHGACGPALTAGAAMADKRRMRQRLQPHVLAAATASQAASQSVPSIRCLRHRAAAGALAGWLLRSRPAPLTVRVGLPAPHGRRDRCTHPPTRLTRAAESAPHGCSALRGRVPLLPPSIFAQPPVAPRPPRPQFLTTPASGSLPHDDSLVRPVANL